LRRSARRQLSALIPVIPNPLVGPESRRQFKQRRMAEFGTFLSFLGDVSNGKSCQ